LIYNEVDVLTTSKLLGHTSMKHTQRYVDAPNEMKEAATNKLNFQLYVNQKYKFESFYKNRKKWKL